MRVFKFVGMGILGVAAIGLFILGTMHLWNCLIPVLFHGPIVTYWQTAGLLILSKILFSGFGCCKHHKKRHHDNCCDGEHHGHKSWWKHFHNMKHDSNCCSKTE